MVQTISFLTVAWNTDPNNIHGAAGRSDLDDQTVVTVWSTNSAEIACTTSCAQSACEIKWSPSAARLQSEFCTIPMFFSWATEKIPQKIPGKSPGNFPSAARLQSEFCTIDVFFWAQTTEKNPAKFPANLPATFLGDRYDWTTRVPDNGNDWRKFRAVPRSYPLRSLVLHFV